MTLALVACCLFFQGLSPEVIEHSQAGAAAMRQGNLDAAIQEYRTVTELQPDSAPGHANLGGAYFQKGDYGKALPELELALKYNPNLMDTHQILGILLLIQGNPEGALPHLEKMRTPELLGVAYLETGRFGNAIVALEAALGRAPKDLNLLYYYGRATALASKRAADELAKLNSQAGSKGNAGADTGSQTPQDLPSLQKALAKEPENAGLLAAFSRAAEAASKKSFDAIVEINPNSARAHQVQAERYVESGQLREAGQQYVESLQLNPNASNVHLALGDVYAALGQWAAAAVQYGMETRIQPFDADSHYRLGSALLKQGQAEGAVEELSDADRLKPDSPQILMTLGEAAAAANDAGRAESAWKGLLSIDKGSGLAASAHLGLSQLYRRAGKLQDADREMAAYQQLRKQGNP